MKWDSVNEITSDDIIKPKEKEVEEIEEYDDKEPKERACGKCKKIFLSTPVIHGFRVVGTPLFCNDCDRKHGLWLRKNEPLHNPKLIFKFVNDARGIKAVRVLGEKDDGAHAKHSPSALKNKEVCPGWINDKTADIHPVTEQGTELHKRLVTKNFDGLEPEPLLILKMVSELFDSLIKSLMPDAFVSQEIKLDVAGLTFGTADLIVVKGHKAIVGDAKFGFVAVEDTETNIQGICYVVGVFYKFPKVTQVEVVFLQPRRDEVSRHTFIRSCDYDNMVARIKKIIDACDDPDKVLNPTVENCLYCGAKATCPALTQIAISMAHRYNPIEIPSDAHPSSWSKPEQFALGERVRKVITAWADSAKHAAIAYRLAGNEIPGFDLAERSGKRTITNAQKAWEIVKEKLSPEEFASACTVSAADLENIFAEKAPRGKKQQSKQALEDALTDADAISQGSSVYYLKKTK